MTALGVRRPLTAAGGRHLHYSLAAASDVFGDVSRLPRSLKVVLEGVLRLVDAGLATPEDAQALIRRDRDAEVPFLPARVLMQDLSGVPVLVDLAAMRDAAVRSGADPLAVDTVLPVDLVVDHSVSVDFFGSADALRRNVELEYCRNQERYEFLKWAAHAFGQLRVVPPGTGICHQVNLEFLSQVVATRRQGDQLLAFPDTVLGTDSHTTMVNGLGVLGWGIGGLEAESVVLGLPVRMLVPRVVGCRLDGELPEGATGTDLVLTLTERLRAEGVVGSFVEFYGQGVDRLGLPDMATIANMAPDYGATCGYFPICDATLRYLAATGRPQNRIDLVEAYAKEQGLWAGGADIEFDSVVEVDLGSVEPCLAGPRRPQDRVPLRLAARSFENGFAKRHGRPLGNASGELQDGAVVIAAVTSCTNTSNPSLMLAAGLVAERAAGLGLAPRPWVKTSFAPGSRVVVDYLERAGLHEGLSRLGFDVVGLGCTTCIGMAGPLVDGVAGEIDRGRLVTAAVLSGNRNFEGRIHPDVREAYLASPPLVVAYSLAGSMRFDFAAEPLGCSPEGKPVYLRDLWPSSGEIGAALAAIADPALYRARYERFDDNDAWAAIEAPDGPAMEWSASSTYIRRPPLDEPPGEIAGARILAVLGDSVSTDHLSPAGPIPHSPAGRYLAGLGVTPADLSTYGARRGNYEVVMRGSLSNVLVESAAVEGKRGRTVHHPSDEVLTLFDAAARYREEGVPLIVVAGREYGTGSSRDQAAKGVKMLGVRAVLAESFERIQRANLVAVGVLPIEAAGLRLVGNELVDVPGLDQLTPRGPVEVVIRAEGREPRRVRGVARIDTKFELRTFRAGGLLPYCTAEVLAR